MTLPGMLLSRHYFQDMLPAYLRMITVHLRGHAREICFLPTILQFLNVPARSGQPASPGADITQQVLCIRPERRVLFCIPNELLKTPDCSGAPDGGKSCCCVLPDIGQLVSGPHAPDQNLDRSPAFQAAQRRDHGRPDRRIAVSCQVHQGADCPWIPAFPESHHRPQPLLPVRSGYCRIRQIVDGPFPGKGIIPLNIWFLNTQVHHIHQIYSSVFSENDTSSLPDCQKSILTDEKKHPLTKNSPYRFFPDDREVNGLVHWFTIMQSDYK